MDLLTVVDDPVEDHVSLPVELSVVLPCHHNSVCPLRRVLDRRPVPRPAWVVHQVQREGVGCAEDARGGSAIVMVTPFWASSRAKTRARVNSPALPSGTPYRRSRSPVTASIACKWSSSGAPTGGPSSMDAAHAAIGADASELVAGRPPLPPRVTPVARSCEPPARESTATVGICSWQYCLKYRLRSGQNSPFLGVGGFSGCRNTNKAGHLGR